MEFGGVEYRNKYVFQMHIMLSRDDVEKINDLCSLMRKYYLVDEFRCYRSDVMRKALRIAWFLFSNVDEDVVNNIISDYRKYMVGDRNE